RRIQRLVAVALLPVGLDPIRDRLDQVARANARRYRGVDVGPRAGGHPAEDSRAECRALVDRDALEGQLEDRGDDLGPQVTTRAAARDATAVGRVAAELGD